MSATWHKKSATMPNTSGLDRSRRETALPAVGRTMAQLNEPTRASRWSQAPSTKLRRARPESLLPPQNVRAPRISNMDFEEDFYDDDIDASHNINAGRATNQLYASLPPLPSLPPLAQNPAELLQRFRTEHEVRVFTLPHANKPRRRTRPQQALDSTQGSDASADALAFPSTSDNDGSAGAASGDAAGSASHRLTASPQTTPRGPAPASPHRGSQRHLSSTLTPRTHAHTGALQPSPRHTRTPSQSQALPSPRAYRHQFPSRRMSQQMSLPPPLPLPRNASGDTDTGTPRTPFGDDAPSATEGPVPTAAPAVAEPEDEDDSASDSDGVAAILAVAGGGVGAMGEGVPRQWRARLCHVPLRRGGAAPSATASLSSVGARDEGGLVHGTGSIGASLLPPPPWLATPPLPPLDLSQRELVLLMARTYARPHKSLANNLFYHSSFRALLRRVGHLRYEAVRDTHSLADASATPFLSAAHELAMLAMLFLHGPGDPQHPTSYPTTRAASGGAAGKGSVDRARTRSAGVGVRAAVPDESTARGDALLQSVFHDQPVVMGGDSSDEDELVAKLCNVRARTGVSTHTRGPKIAEARSPLALPLGKERSGAHASTSTRVLHDTLTAAPPPLVPWTALRDLFHACIEAQPLVYALMQRARGAPVTGDTQVPADTAAHGTEHEPAAALPCVCELPSVSVQLLQHTIRELAAMAACYVCYRYNAQAVEQSGKNVDALVGRDAEEEVEVRVVGGDATAVTAEADAVVTDAPSTEQQPDGVPVAPSHANADVATESTEVPFTAASPILSRLRRRRASVLDDADTIRDAAATPFLAQRAARHAQQAKAATAGKDEAGAAAATASLRGPHAKKSSSPVSDSSTPSGTGLGDGDGDGWAPARAHLFGALPWSVFVEGLGTWVAEGVSGHYTGVDFAALYGVPVPGNADARVGAAAHMCGSCRGYRSAPTAAAVASNTCCASCLLDASPPLTGDVSLQPSPSVLCRDLVLFSLQHCALFTLAKSALSRRTAAVADVLSLPPYCRVHYPFTVAHVADVIAESDFALEHCLTRAQCLRLALFAEVRYAAAQQRIVAVGDAPSLVCVLAGEASVNMHPEVMDRYCVFSPVPLRLADQLHADPQVAQIPVAPRSGRVSTYINRYSLLADSDSDSAREEDEDEDDAGTATEFTATGSRRARGSKITASNGNAARALPLFTGMFGGWVRRLSSAHKCMLRHVKGTDALVADFLATEYRSCAQKVREMMRERRRQMRLEAEANKLVSYADDALKRRQRHGTQRKAAAAEAHEYAAAAHASSPPLQARRLSASLSPRATSTASTPRRNADHDVASSPRIAETQPSPRDREHGSSVARLSLNVFTAADTSDSRDSISRGASQGVAASVPSSRHRPDLHALQAPERETPEILSEDDDIPEPSAAEFAQALSGTRTASMDTSAVLAFANAVRASSRLAGERPVSAHGAAAVDAAESYRDDALSLARNSSMTRVHRLSASFCAGLTSVVADHPHLMTITAAEPCLYLHLDRGRLFSVVGDHLEAVLARKMAMLRDLPIFVSLDEVDLRMIASAARVRTVQDGTMLKTQGAHNRTACRCRPKPPALHDPADTPDAGAASAHPRTAQPTAWPGCTGGRTLQPTLHVAHVDTHYHPDLCAHGSAVGVAAVSLGRPTAAAAQDAEEKEDVPSFVTGTDSLCACLATSRYPYQARTRAAVFPLLHLGADATNALMGPVLPATGGVPAQLFTVRTPLPLILHAIDAALPLGSQDIARALTSMLRAADAPQEALRLPNAPTQNEDALPAPAEEDATARTQRLQGLVSVNRRGSLVFEDAMVLVQSGEKSVFSREYQQQQRESAFQQQWQRAQQQYVDAEVETRAHTTDHLPAGCVLFPALPPQAGRSVGKHTRALQSSTPHLDGACLTATSSAQPVSSSAAQSAPADAVAYHWPPLVPGCLPSSALVLAAPHLLHSLVRMGGRRRGAWLPYADLTDRGVCGLELLVAAALPHLVNYWNDDATRRMPAHSHSLARRLFHRAQCRRIARGEWRGTAADHADISGVHALDLRAELAFAGVWRLVEQAKKVVRALRRRLAKGKLRGELAGMVRRHQAGQPLPPPRATAEVASLSGGSSARSDITRVGDDTDAVAGGSTALSASQDPRAELMLVLEEEVERVRVARTQVEVPEPAEDADVDGDEDAGMGVGDVVEAVEADISPAPALNTQAPSTIGVHATMRRGALTPAARRLYTSLFALADLPITHHAQLHRVQFDRLRDSIIHDILTRARTNVVSTVFKVPKSVLPSAAHSLACPRNHPSPTSAAQHADLVAELLAVHPHHGDHHTSPAVENTLSVYSAALVASPQPLPERTAPALLLSEWDWLLYVPPQLTQNLVTGLTACPPLVTVARAAREDQHWRGYTRAATLSVARAAGTLRGSSRQLSHQAPLRDVTSCLPTYASAEVFADPAPATIITQGVVRDARRAATNVGSAAYMMRPTTTRATPADGASSEVAWRVHDAVVAEVLQRVRGTVSGAQWSVTGAEITKPNAQAASSKGSAQSVPTAILAEAVAHESGIHGYRESLRAVDLGIADRMFGARRRRVRAKTGGVDGGVELHTNKTSATNDGFNGIALGDLIPFCEE